MNNDIYYNKYIKYKTKYLEINSKYTTVFNLKKALIKYTKDMIDVLSIDVSIINKYYTVVLKNNKYLYITKYTNAKSKVIDTVNTELVEQKNIKWEWNEIKKEFADNVKMMELFVNFRTKLVNNLLFLIFSYFKNCDNVCISKPKWFNWTSSNIII